MIRFTQQMAAIAVATIVMTVMLAAQPGQRMTPQERTDKLTKDLELTKEQQPKVLAIFTKSQESMKAVFDEHQGDREAMRPLMQKIRQDSDDQLKKVLTVKQYELMMKLRAEAPGRQGGDRQRPAPAPDAPKTPAPEPSK